MPRKEKLSIRTDTGAITLFGISTSLKDFRLCYLLKKYLDWDFAKFDDLPAAITGSDVPEMFSLYMFRDEDRFNTYFLLANRTLDKYLFPAIRQADFFLILEGPVKKSCKESMLKAIRKIPNIQMAFETEPGQVKDIELLLSDLELHVLSRTHDKGQKF